MTIKMLLNAMASAASIAIRFSNVPTHLIPVVEKEKGKYTLLSLAAGIFIAVLIVATHG